MFVIIKNMSGCDYPIYDKNTGKVKRVISFRGGCYANDISVEDFNLLKNAYPSFARAVDEGYIIAKDTNVKGEVDKAVADTRSEMLTKQSKKQKEAKAATNVDIDEK